jgi:hypothetical protein
MSNPTSPWFTYDQFCNRFGTKNIAVASNKENTSTDPNLPAVQDAFDEALEAVQDEMRGGPYIVPFDFTPNGGQCPWKIRVWGMTIAYAALYIGGRGVQEKQKDSVGDKISKLVSNIYREIGFAKAGLLQLNLKTATTTSGQTISQSIGIIRSHGLWQRFGLDGAPALGR